MLSLLNPIGSSETLRATAVRFSVVLVMLLSFEARASNPEAYGPGDGLGRIALSGYVDSNGERGFWEERTRVPVDGIVVTTDTYVRMKLHGGAGSVQQAQVMDVYEVHRVHLSGSISSEAYAAITRIALNGEINSINDHQRVRRVPFKGSVVSDIGAVALRYGLDGVISNVSDEVELAYLRRTDPTRVPPIQVPDIPIVGDIAGDVEPAVVRDDNVLWSRSKGLLGLIETSIRSYVRTDSINRSGFEQEDYSLLVVEPLFQVMLEQAKWKLDGHYKGESGEYITGDDDSYVNHELAFDFTRRVATNDQIGIGSRYRNWHDKRTRQAIEDFNSGLVGSFDNDAIGLDVTWEHGRKSDRLRFMMSVETEQESVDSEADDVFGYDLRHDTVEATAYFRVQRRSTVFLRSELQNFDYKDRDDSKQYRLSPGWEYTPNRRIALNAEAGYERKVYENSRFGGLIWDADISWRPRRNTTLEFRTAREFLEVFARNGTVRPGEFGLQEYQRFNVRQKWNPKWASDFSVTYQRRDFEGSEIEEEASQFEFSTSFKMTPRVTLNGDGAYTKQRTVGSTDYDRWTLTLRADVKL
jgi:hypothetical protein